jgi:glycosyltransferase involved in cell wall biosynthesis
VLAHLAERPSPAPPLRTDGLVVLFFGLLRPYKGIDVLLEAWREGIDGAELWIVGPPRMDIAPLRAAAPPSVRFVPRFVGDAELPGYFCRADLVVLPYREIEQSGVLFTALAFGKPLLLSDVGGFAEVAAGGLARAVPPGDSAALRAALEQLLGDAGAREALAARSRAASAGEYGWERIAQRTLALYRSLLGENPLP